MCNLYLWEYGLSRIPVTPVALKGLEEELSQTEVKQKCELRDKSSREWLPEGLSLVLSPLIMLTATNSLICAGGFYR